jgi:hypothetical protein
VTIVIVVCAVVVVALSAALAIGLSRAAAHGDEGMNEDLALIRAHARKRGASGVPPQRG